LGRPIECEGAAARDDSADERDRAGRGRDELAGDQDQAAADREQAAVERAQHGRDGVPNWILGQARRRMQAVRGRRGPEARPPTRWDRPLRS
jgi:hypothetical protein